MVRLSVIFSFCMNRPRSSSDPMRCQLKSQRKSFFPSVSNCLCLFITEFWMTEIKKTQNCLNADDIGNGYWSCLLAVDPHDFVQDQLSSSSNISYRLVGCNGRREAGNSIPLMKNVILIQSTTLNWLHFIAYFYWPHLNRDSQLSYCGAIGILKSSGGRVHISSIHEIY